MQVILAHATYHVIVIARGKKTYMTATPVTHAEACTMLSKLTRYAWRVETLERAT